MDNKKINIMFVMPSLHKGGAEKVMSTIASELNTDIFNVTFVLLEKRGSYLNNLNNSIKLIDLNSKNVKKSFFPLLKVIRYEKPDIVFSALAHLSIIMSIIKLFVPKKTKFIVRETNIPSTINQSEKLPIIFNLFYKTLYKTFNQIIAQSNDMKNDLLDNFNYKNEKITTINNPINIEKISDMIKNENNKVVLNSDNINYIAIGSYEHRKGFDMLLKAWSLSDTKNKHLTIIGEGSQKNFLLKLIDNYKINDTVTILDFQMNPYIYLSQANYYILSSRHEGFPNVLLESLACGTPAIAFQCSGGVNEIIKNSNNGWLVQLGDIDSLSKSISNTPSHKWSSEEIQNDIYDRYSKNKIIAKYEELFINIVKEKNEE